MITPTTGPDLELAYIILLLLIHSFGEKKYMHAGWPVEKQKIILSFKISKENPVTFNFAQHGLCERIQLTD